MNPASPVDCERCPLRTPDYFCASPPELLAKWGRLSIPVCQPFGAQFLLEGQQPQGVYLVCRGAVKLAFTRHGLSAVSRVARQGEVLGVREALVGGVVRYTAEALEPLQLRFMPRQEFVQLLMEHRESCSRVVRQLALEGDAADRSHSLALEDSTAVRVARLLLDLCDERGQATEHGIRVRLDMRHRDLGQLIGTSRETVTRRLSELRHAGVIVVKGATIFIRNRAALEQLIVDERQRRY